MGMGTAMGMKMRNGDGDGANYVLALVHCHIDDFLRDPDHGLINRFLPFEPSFGESSAGARVTNIQVNFFECGGIVMGLCISHKIFDVASLNTFLKGCANMACEDKEVVYPNLTAPTLFPVKSLWLRDTTIFISQSMLKEGKCRTKRFVFISNDIATLKAEVTRYGVQKPTRVKVDTTLIWKCIMATSKEACGHENTFRLTHIVNLYRKLDSKTSKDFICNMIWISNAVCQASYVTTLHDMVNTAHESISKVDSDFMNKAQGNEGYIAMQKALQEMGEVVSEGPIN